MISRRLAFQTAAIVLGPLQFGLHMAELNAPLPFMGCKGVENENQDCIPGIGDGAYPSSIYAIGGVVSSILAGPLADRFGRRNSLFYGATLFLVGSLLMSMASTLNQLVLGRFITGTAAGQAIVVAPMFVNEIAPKSWRGRLGATNQIAVNAGIVLTQLAGWLWASYAWRRILIVGVLCAIIWLFSLMNIYESPRWLRSNQQFEQAHIIEEILVYSPDEDLTVESDSHVASMGEAFYAVWRFLTLRRFRTSLFLIAGILMLQQFSGINAIVFYGVPIFQKAVPKYARAVNLFLSISNIAVTGFSAQLIDLLGRRPLLLASLAGMCVGTTLIAWSLTLDHAYMACVSALLVVGSFAVGVGPIPFLIIGELVSQKSLGTAQSVGITFNWLATFMVGALFPGLMDTMGPSVFYLFSLCSLAGIWLIYRFLPETT